MNAERLHAICADIRDSLESTDLLSKLNAVIMALQNVVNQPQQPGHQQQLTQHLEKLFSTLSDFPTDKFSPAWRQSLDELGGTDILGYKLAQHIRAIFERNQITPASALQQSQKILEELQQFSEAVNSVTQGFEQLGIGAEELMPGECEIGVLVPRDAIHNNIHEFGKELQDLNFVFGTFSELACGSRDTFKIKTISSSDLMVFLTAVPFVASCIAYSTERIFNLYKTLCEIKKLRAELNKLGLKDEEMTGITEHANLVMSKGIEELTIEIVDEYYEGSDPNRKSELANAIRISLNKLANRIDQGFNLEVRAEPPEEPAEQNAESDKELKARRHIQIVIDASESLQFMKLQGRRLLHLPEEATKPKTTDTE